LHKLFLLKFYLILKPPVSNKSSLFKGSTRRGKGFLYFITFHKIIKLFLQFSFLVKLFSTGYFFLLFFYSRYVFSLYSGCDLKSHSE